VPVIPPGGLPSSGVIKGLSQGKSLAESGPLANTQKKKLGK